MLQRAQLAIKLIQEATTEFLQKLIKVKRKEAEIIREIDKEKSEQRIKEIKEKLEKTY